MRIDWFSITCRRQQSQVRIPTTSLCKRREGSMRINRVIGLCFFLLPVGILGQTPQATPPPPAAPRSATFPKPSEQTLANGLRVIVVERSDTPLVSAQLLIKNGGEVDPPQLAGLADMTANLLTKGTETRDATKIAEQVESLGGAIESGARWDASTVTVGVMPARIGPAMEILADVIRHPTFKTE